MKLRFRLVLLALVFGISERHAYAAPGDVDLLFNPNAPENYVYSTVVQPDGTIVIGGSFATVGGMPRPVIARLNANGTLDLGFSPVIQGQVSSILVQADRKVVIGGSFSIDGGAARKIARLNTDGTLDPAFNTNANGLVSTISVLGDGKMIIGGEFSTVGGVTRRDVARLNADGTLDATFNAGVGTAGSVLGVAVQADGKIVIGGTFIAVAACHGTGSHGSTPTGL